MNTIQGNGSENTKNNGFWSGVFSKSNKESYGRVAAGFALINGIGWIWYLVLKVSSATEFVQLPQLAIFIGAVLSLVAGIYGLSKGLDVIKDVKTQNNTTPPHA